MMAKKKTISTSGPIEMKTGRVIKNTGSAYLVKTDNGENISCKVKGNFRIKGIRTTNPVAVGDMVTISETSDNAWFITAISPRKNYIIRRASNLSKESHILAANIDLALLVATVKDPLTPTTFIDRFLATAEAYSVDAAIIFNKEDIWDEDDREYAEALKHLYSTIGYQVFVVSAQTHYGIGPLKDLLKNKISLLAGNSGVGKSSLINAIIPGANLKTGNISEIHHAGTHTTTFSEMIELPGGGALIDVPGIRGFGTLDFEPEQVGHYFPEIFKMSADCKYGNCTHTNEPGCAIKKALEDHYISESRYASYLSVLEDAMAKEGEEKYRKPF